MNNLFKSKQNISSGVDLKRAAQKRQILKSIYFNGPMSNAEIGRQLTISAPKMNGLLMELINDGLLRDLGPGDSSGGRRPSIYGSIKDGYYLVGISLGVYKTGIAIFNSSNEEIIKQFFPVNIKKDIRIFGEISKYLDKVIQDAKIDPDKIIAVGLEMPGLVNSDEGINKTYFPDHENLYETVQDQFKFPVYYENDAKVRAYAEKHFGLAKNVDNALVLNVDWGVGLGIIVKGELYRGATGFAGEFGHLPIVENGVLCKCGKKGCLETIASATAIVRMAKEGMNAGSPSLINEYTNYDTEAIEISYIIKAAFAGDQFAISILSNVGHWLGRGIVFLIQIFNPEIIILEGIASESYKYLEAPIQQAINTHSNSDISSSTKIMFSKLGTGAGIKGAAAMAFEKLVTFNTIN